MRLQPALVLGVAMIGACVAAAADPSPASRPAATGRLTSPEVWMCTAHVEQLVEPGAKWDFVRKHLSGVKLYIGTLNKTPADTLAQLAKMLKDNRLQVAVECGGTLDFAPMDATNGEKSAEIELRGFTRFVKAGGRIDFLDMDGPVRRLLYPKRAGKPIQGFTSVDKCADELMDYMRAVRKALPKMRFFVLTNFPNWGYRGDVSYHARGPKRQDNGDYDEVIRTLLKHAKDAGQQFAGVTVDNPYEYAVGEHFSVKLEDPKKVDWIGRIRAYEDFARAEKLDFNLIVNSEAGGKESDEAFMQRTLKMVEAYQKAGGKPTRYVVQSWYEHPTQIVPETAEHSMTALVKAVMLQVHPELK